MTSIKHHLVSKGIFKLFVWMILLLLLLFLLGYQLDRFPPLWWDEGWTLSAARNWVDNGHLGNYIAGQAVPPSIVVRFPVVVPVALSMKVFGTGTWQGRLPGVIFTILALMLLFKLSERLFNRTIGVAAIVLLCLSFFSFSPFIIGRETLAEMPMLFYSLAGFILVWLAMNRSSFWVVGASLIFGVAILSKLQVLPFWLFSVCLGIGLAYLKGWRKPKFILCGVLFGSLCVYLIILLIQNYLMPESFNDSALQKLLFNTVVFVWDWPVRWQAIKNVLILGLPELLSFAAFGYYILNDIIFNQNNSTINVFESNRIVITVSFWGFGASWFGWYIAMALFWERYLYPPYFLGTMFLAFFLEKVTEGYDIRLLVRRASNLLTLRGTNRKNFLALIVFMIFGLVLSITILSVKLYILSNQQQPEAATSWLEHNVRSGQLVETFESELFFLAPNLSYHFPSDLVSMELVRRKTVDPQQKINYDPLSVNPDYLVIGPYARTWQLYDTVITRDEWKLVQDIGGYQVYQHLNPQP